MQKWEVMEPYLFTVAAMGQAFNAVAMADDLGITTREASGYIQAYLSAQRRGKNPPTQFVLSRRGRTSGTMWQVGSRVADARGLSRQEAQDMLNRVQRAIAPDLNRMGVHNPRIAGMVTAQVNAFVANLQALISAL